MTSYTRLHEITQTILNSLARTYQFFHNFSKILQTVNSVKIESNRI